LNGALVAFTLGVEIARSSIEKADVLRPDVDVPEETLLHERPIAFRITVAEADELIEVESADLGPVHFFRLCQPDELLVERERGAPGRQAEYRPWQSSDRIHDHSPERRGKH
jgi:hypothetical protein